MEIASTEDILTKFRELKVWSTGDQRAPHKPLLALWAIGRCLSGEPRLASYQEADHALRALLQDFGPHRKRIHTEHPFWRLRNDDVWEVEREEIVRITSSGDALRTSLLENDVHAGLPTDIHESLTTDTKLAKQLAHELVDAHFPVSLHDEILQAVGIEPAYVTSRRKPRDPDFRDKVLAAYGHQCAVCGFAVRLNEKPVGLEAAHIKWHGANGPDVVANALSLCALHHRLFDKGAFTVSPRRLIVVARNVSGRGVEDALGRFNWRPLAPPTHGDNAPDPRFSTWHAEEVFGCPEYLASGR